MGSSGRANTHTNAELMRLAVFEAARWWISFDGPQHDVVAANGGTLTVEDIERIGLVYGVIRNLQKTSRDMAVREANSYRGTAGLTLRERADRIKDSVRILAGENNCRPASAMTKLVLFVEPDNWTPFDSLASEGAGCTKSDVVDRMEEFYGRLEKQKFLDAAKCITEKSAESPFAAVTGPRVLDKYLMFRGGADTTLARHVQNIMPGTSGAQLDVLAERIAGDGDCYLKALPSGT